MNGKSQSMHPESCPFAYLSHYRSRVVANRGIFSMARYLFDCSKYQQPVLVRVPLWMTTECERSPQSSTRRAGEVAILAFLPHFSFLYLVLRRYLVPTASDEVELFSSWNNKDSVGTCSNFRRIKKRFHCVVMCLRIKCFSCDLKSNKIQ